MSTDNARLVLEMIHAVERRDIDRLLEIYGPDVAFHWPPALPYGGVYQGHAVIKMGEAFASAWDPIQRTEEARLLHPRVLGVNGDEVTVLYHQRGETADGGLWETEVIGVYRVVDEHVVRLQMFYFDPTSTAAFLAQAPGQPEVDHEHS